MKALTNVLKIKTCGCRLMLWCRNILNYSEHLYGLVTNGKQLRLLRDASRLTRLSYVEFNLEKIMEEDLYSDFVILYRLLHKSRMPQQQEAGAESIIEKYHQE